LPEHLRLKVVPRREQRRLLAKDLDDSIIRGLCQPRPTRGAILGLNRLKLRYDTPIQSLFSGDQSPQPDALG
jgi:hypothetical protein